MYVIGMVMAIVVAKGLGSTMFKDKGSTFLLELPPYRVPDSEDGTYLETRQGQGLPHQSWYHHLRRIRPALGHVELQLQRPA